MLDDCCEMMLVTGSKPVVERTLIPDLKLTLQQVSTPNETPLAF